MGLTLTHDVTANGKIYTVVDDFPAVFRAVVTGLVTDEIPGSVDAPDFSIRSDWPDLLAKTTPAGLYAISGYVEKAFPNLSSTSYTLNLVFSGAGMQDYKLAVTVPMNASFPVSAPPVALRRLPVRIQGRVVADTAQRLPIAGATVVSVDDPGSPPALHTMALRSPLYLPHPQATTVREIGMTAVGGAQLAQNAVAGDTVVNLTNRTSLAVNTVLRLFNPSETQVDYAIVQSLGPGAGAGLAFLRQPLRRSYASGLATAVQFLNPGAPATTATLAADADTGDGVLIASKLLTASPVEVEPGTGSTEYHELGALSGGDGYYSLDGVCRVREIFLEASHAAFTGTTDAWMVRYDQGINVVDFRLHP